MDRGVLIETASYCKNHSQYTYSQSGTTQLVESSRLDFQKLSRQKFSLSQNTELFPNPTPFSFSEVEC